MSEVRRYKVEVTFVERGDCEPLGDLVDVARFVVSQVRQNTVVDVEEAWASEVDEDGRALSMRSGVVKIDMAGREVAR